MYQDLALCDNLDVVQNMYLGREAHDALLRLIEPEMERADGETLASLSVTTIRSIRLKVAGLSGGQRQSVAVARAVMWNSQARDPRRADRRARRRADAPGARPRRAPRPSRDSRSILISHNLHDIFDVADRITVLRLGRNVAEFERRETTAAGGRRGDHRRAPPPGSPASPTLKGIAE